MHDHKWSTEVVGLRRHKWSTGVSINGPRALGARSGLLVVDRSPARSLPLPLPVPLTLTLLLLSLSLFPPPLRSDVPAILLRYAVRELSRPVHVGACAAASNSPRG